MKKIYSIALVVALLAAVFAGCAAPEPAAQPAAEPAAEPAADVAAEPAADLPNEIVAPEEPYKIGWSTIYLSPSWMQITNAMLEERAEYWKEQGVIAEVTVANANGDMPTQITQIDNMISQGYDAIIVVVGSETAANPVCEKAEAAGIRVISFDSMPSTDKITCKMTPSQEGFGRVWAEWMVEQLDGVGEIIVAGGPSGVAVADQRRAGALEVLEGYPDIKIIGEVTSEYNEGPAIQAIQPLVSANPDVDGILALGGAQSSAALKILQERGTGMLPVTGENYNGFLRTWEEEVENGFSSIAICQPNWMVKLSLDAAVRSLQGFSVPKNIEITAPTITNENLAEYVPNDFPDDYYCLPDITEEDYDKYLGPLVRE